jgi:hypothetical protein
MVVTRCQIRSAIGCVLRQGGLVENHYLLAMLVKPVLGWIARLRRPLLISPKSIEG